MLLSCPCCGHVFDVPDPETKKEEAEREEDTDAVPAQLRD